MLTREQVQGLLDIHDHVKVMHTVGHALVYLFQQQTRMEQSLNETTATNYRGFNQPDAWQGSVAAKYYLKNKKLESWQVKKWTKREASGFSRLTKYWRQLDAAAIEKAKRRGAAPLRQPVQQELPL